MSKILLDQPAPKVARITLNDPDRRNAFGSDVRKLLAETFRDIFNNASLRAVILTGAGGNFSAGGDISAFGAIEPAQQLTNVRAAQAMVRSVMQGDMPIIAAVEGYAAGAGVGLACMCDFVLGDANTKFVLSFVKIGMVPDMGLHATLSHRVGLARARRMLLLGQRVDAAEAHQIGLLDELAPTGTVQDRAVAIASELAQGPSVAMASLKRGIYVAAAQLDAVLEYEAAAMAVAMSGAEVKEGAAAFFEKRPARFS